MRRPPTCSHAAAASLQFGTLPAGTCDMTGVWDGEMSIEEATSAGGADGSIAAGGAPLNVAAEESLPGGQPMSQ